MTNTRPKFSQERYDKYDALAKAAALDVLKMSYPESQVIEVPESCGDDLYILFGTNRIGVETEIRDTWKPKQFPYKTIQLPKSKVDKALLRNEVTWFLIFNSARTAVCKIVVTKATEKMAAYKFNKFSLDKPEAFYNFELTNENVEFIYDER